MLFRQRALLFLMTMLSSCANRVAPEGGAKDSAPPKLISSQPENFSHSFQGSEITLQFDEYIQLLDAEKQIIVSPLTDEKPEITASKKTLKVKFKKPLHANTTYTISFGNAVADIHESNALTGFRFVFSTGSFVDSLSIAGIIADAFTLQPAGDVTVMLYNNNDDSLPYHSRPAYITVSDAAGNFKFENLSASTFKLFALKDKNNNYLYDHHEETIAWADEPVKAGDSVLHALLLIKELPKKTKLLNVIAAEPGKAILAFNKKANVELKAKSGVASWHSYSFNQTGDSITVWMADTLNDSLNVYLYENNQLFDLVSLALKKPASIKQQKSTMLPFTVSVKAFRPGEKISFTASHPLQETNPQLIKIIADSAENHLQNLKTESETYCVSDFMVMTEKKYELLLLPGAMKDIYGRTNDTLKVPVKVLSEKETGSLFIQLNNVYPHPLLISLVNDKEQSIRDTVLTGSTPAVFFSYLPAGVYKLKAVEDCHQNGRWDTGDYLKKQKPERVTYFKEPVTIRANWDVETTWKPEFK